MDVLAEVKKARRQHGVTVEALEEVGRVAPERAAERSVGMASHGLRDGSVAWTLTRAVLKTREDEIVYEDWQRTRAVCTLAVLDGYVLAQAVLGKARVKRTFKGEGALTRFAKTAASSGDGLRAGPQGAAVAALVASAVKGLRPAVRALTGDLVAQALAAGVLLYATERELVFPGVQVTRAARLPASGAPAAQASSPELLAAVFAAPFDDRPRLVYGDWLTEQNDPQGLLIALQCGPQTGQSAELAKTLVSRHQKGWVQPYRAFINRWEFRRGFINAVTADFAKFFAGQPALGRLPLLHAKLTGYRAEQLRLADAAPHPTLGSVDLGNNRLGERGPGLLGRPFFARVTSVDLAGNSLEPTAVEALVAALPAGVLRLQLTSTDLTTEGLAALSQWKHFSRLTHLDLRYNRSLDAGALALLARATGLEYLGLSMHQYRAADVERVAALALPKLTRLALHGEDVGGLPAFLKTRTLPALAALDLPFEVPRKVTEALEARFPPAPWPRHFEY